MPCQTKMCIDRKTNQDKIYSPWDPPFYDDRYIYHGHRLLHSAWARCSLIKTSPEFCSRLLICHNCDLSVNGSRILIRLRQDG